MDNMTDTTTHSLSNISATDLQADANNSQYLTFMLSGEEYGLDILNVQEIREWEPVTVIPNVPPYIEGVLNVRGVIAPIIDLRLLFSLEKLEKSPTTVVILLKVAGEQVIGVMVDAVSDVYSVAGEHINKGAILGESLDARFIHGLAKIEDKVVILLELESLLDFEELQTQTRMEQS